MQTKTTIENIFNGVQILIYFLFIMVILNFLLFKYKPYVFLFVVFLFWSLRFLNPITANYNLYKSQKQLLFGGGPNEDNSDKNGEIETFSEM
jgi:hypothetical protein